MKIKYNNKDSFLQAILSAEEGAISIDELSDVLRQDSDFCSSAIKALEARLYTREYLLGLIHNWQIQNNQKDNFDSIFGDQIDFSDKIRYAYAHAPNGVREDASVIAIIIEFINNFYSFEFQNITVIEQLITSLPESCLGNKLMVMELLKFDSIVFRYASADLKNDKETVLAAVKHNGSELRYASEALRNDKDVVMEAIKTQNYSLMSDIDYGFPHAYQFISEALQNDITIARFAVEHGFPVFRLSSEELHTNAELNQIFNNQQNDKFWVDDNENLPILNNAKHEAFENNVGTFEDMEDNQDLIPDYEWFKANRNNLEECDKAVIMNQVCTSPQIIKDISPKLKEDYAFMLSVVSTCGMAYRFLPRDLKVQPSFAMEALKQDNNVINYLRPEILKNSEIILAVLLQNHYLIVPDNESFVNFQAAEYHVEAKMKAILNLQGPIHIENYDDMQKLFWANGYAKITQMHYSDDPPEISYHEIWEKTEKGNLTLVTISVNKLFDRDDNLLVGKAIWDEALISSYQKRTL